MFPSSLDFGAQGGVCFHNLSAHLAPGSHFNGPLMCPWNISNSWVDKHACKLVDMKLYNHVIVRYRHRCIKITSLILIQIIYIYTHMYIDFFNTNIAHICPIMSRTNPRSSTGRWLQFFAAHRNQLEAVVHSARRSLRLSLGRIMNSTESSGEHGVTVQYEALHMASYGFIWI